MSDILEHQKLSAALVRWRQLWEELRTLKAAHPQLPPSDADRYRLLFEHASDAIFCVDAESQRFVDVNQTACQMLGYTREEILGEPIRRISSGISAEELAEHIQQLEQDGEATIRTRHRRKDGSELPVEVHILAGVLEGRRVYHSIARDLTGRMAVDEARRRADASFRSASKMAHVGAWELDLLTNEPYLSDEVSRIYGIPPGQPPPVEEGIRYYSPEARPIIIDALNRAISEQQPYDLELPFLRKQTQRRWVRTIGEVACSPSGQPLRLYGAIQDITARKRAALLRDALNALHQRTLLLTPMEGLERVLEALWGGLTLLRLPIARCVIAIVDEADRLRDRLVRTQAQSWWIIRDSPADAAVLSACIAASRGHGAPPACSEEVLGLLGAPWPLHDHIISTVQGAVACWLVAEAGETFEAFEQEALAQVVARVDQARQRLDELRAAQRREEMLQQSRKMEAIGRLAGGIAHDFNNLLMVIRGSCELAILDDCGHAIEEIPIIDEAAARAQELTQQLLVFSRKQVLRPRRVDLHAAVQDVLRLLRRIINNTIRIEARLDAARSTVLADPSQLQQAIINLATNARDAMSGGGCLTITTQNTCWTDRSPERPSHLPPGQYVQMIVSDTGSGLDADAQAQIFEPFFTTKKTGEGTGLGLAMVHGTITQSGGHIRVASRQEGGTTFLISLPCCADEGPQPSPPPGAVHVGTERILVIEDDQNVRRIAAGMLRQAGYTATSFSGLRALQPHLGAMSPPPDLLLTDVIMPDGSGLVVADAVRQRFGALPVIFMSGYAEHDLLKTAMAVARSHLLQKPFTRQELLREVRRLLDTPPAGDAP